MQIGWLQIVVIGLLVLVLFGKLPNIIQDLKSAYLELSKKDEEKNNKNVRIIYCETYIPFSGVKSVPILCFYLCIRCNFWRRMLYA
jgi:hypothetical protein